MVFFPMARRAFTLKDVAKAAGVHSSTVSRVLNPSTRHMAGEKVAARVLAVAKRLGYRANRSAATLRTRRSNTIGVVLPDMTNPVFPPILQGIEQELRGLGYVALVANANDDDQQHYVVEQMLARQVDGLILATTTRRDPIVDHCLRAQVPVVSVNRSEDSGRISSVVHDEALGMHLALEHLAALGHRRIAHICGPQHLSTGYLRLRGFLEAAADRGLDPQSLVVSEAVAYVQDAGRVACEALLRAHPAVTAVVAANDLVALGCYQAAKALGRQCPRDISIVGHNDMPFVDLISPALTTVRIAHREMGIQAARLIMQQIRSPGTNLIDIRLKPELVVRGSTAAPREMHKPAKKRRRH